MEKNDWDLVASLAERVGIGIEPVVTERRRLDGDRPRPGSPLTLVIGRPAAGLDLLVRHWDGSDLPALLAEAGEQPVVVGPAPRQVLPQYASWPTLDRSKPIAGHLLFLQTAAVPSRHTLAQLASLGHIDQVVLVSRLFQAMHGDERRMLDALSPLAATARVLLVWYPGEEPTDADLAEVPILARRHASRHGFDGRCLDCCIWTPAGHAPDERLSADPGACMTPDPIEVARGLGPMRQAALARLLREVRERARDEPADPVAPVAPEEATRLSSDLSGYLHDLEKETARMLGERPTTTSEPTRGYLRDAIRGWGAYTTVEGHWMRYVETLRPGLQAAFFNLVEESLDLITVQEPSQVSEPTPPEPEPAPRSLSGWRDRLILEAKRIGIGLVLGILLATLVPALVELPEIGDKLISLALLAVGTILGYGAACALLRTGGRPPRRAGGTGEQQVELHGWRQFQNRLESWFAEQIRATPESVAAECNRLAERLGLTLGDSTS